MQAYYTAHFSREMSCTEAEWLRWLPAAIGKHTWQREGKTVRVEIAPEAVDQHQGKGALTLAWSVGPLRRIAQVALPCLTVRFQFEDLTQGQRYTFMRRFDLYMQRGGG